MSNEWLNIGAGAASGLAGLAGRIGQKKREKRQVGYQKDLMDVQVKNQMKLNEQGKDLAYQQWLDTNAQAQMKQLEKAGLNPALMYGSSGPGGQTSAGSGGSASGGNAPTVEHPSMDIGNMIQATLAGAQKNLMEAQARNLNVKSDKTEGVDTQEAETRIKDILQGIDNKKAQENLTNAQKAGTDLDNRLKDKSLDQQLDLLEWTVNKQRSEAGIAFSQDYVDRNTREEKISILEQESIAAFLNNRAIEAGIRKTEKEIWKMAEDVQNVIRSLEQGDRRLNIENFREEVKANYPSVMQTVGRMTDNAVDQFLGIFGRRRSEKRSGNARQ